MKHTQMNSAQLMIKAFAILDFIDSASSLSDKELALSHAQVLVYLEASKTKSLIDIQSELQDIRAATLAR